MGDVQNINDLCNVAALDVLELPDVHKCVEMLKVKRRIAYAVTGPLRDFSSHCIRNPPIDTSPICLRASRGAREAEHESLGDLAHLRIQFRQAQYAKPSSRGVKKVVSFLYTSF
jgi:hypothetical protein